MLKITYNFCINQQVFKGSFYYDAQRTQRITMTGACTPISGVVHNTCSQESIAKFYYVSPPQVSGSPFETFTYQITDGTSTTTPVAVNVNIKRTNAAPVCANIPAISVDEGNGIAIALSATDNEQPADTLDYFVDAPCKSGTLFQYTGSGKGAEIVTTTGKVKVTDAQHRVYFMPLANEFGNAYCSFGFSAADDGGLLCSSKYVQINVKPVNDAPTAISLGIRTFENTPITVPLQGRDIDNTVDQLTCYLISMPLQGTVYQYSETTTDHAGDKIMAATSAAPAKVTDSKCRVTFVPAPSTYGTTGTQNGVQDYYTQFQYEVKDLDLFSTPANVFIGVTQLNFKGPTPNLPTQTTQEDTSYCFTLTAVQDTPAYPVTSCKIASLPPAFTGVMSLTKNGPAITAGTVIPNCNVCFNPAVNYNDNGCANAGSVATFSYTASDSRKESVPFPVQIKVTPVNDAPTTIRPPVLNAVPLTPRIITVTGRDVDRENLTICISKFPRNGALYTIDTDESHEADEMFIDAGNGCYIVPDSVWKTCGEETTANFYYIANPGFNGTETIEYYVRDGSGTKSDVQVQTIIVSSTDTGSQIPPQTCDVRPNPVATDEDNGVIVTLCGKNFLSSSNFTYYIDTGCRPGTLFQVNEQGKKDAPIEIDSTTKIVRVTNSKGNIMIFPRKDENGPSYCQFGYFVQDSTGLNSSDSFVPVRVNAVNDAPVATPVVVQTKQDASFVAYLTGSDVDSPILYPYIVAAPSKGTLYQYDATKSEFKGAVIPSTASSGSPILITDSQGRVVYTPVAGESGSGNRDGVSDYYSSFQFIIRDGSLTDTNSLSSVVQTVPVGVSKGSVPPVPTFNRLDTVSGKNYSITLTATDADTPASQLVYSVSDLPQKGHLYYADSGKEVTLTAGSGGTKIPAVIPGGRLVYYPAINDASNSDFTYTVSDGFYTVSQRVQITTTVTNTPPVGTTPTPFTFRQGSKSNSLQLTGSDNVTPFDQLKFKVTELPTRGVLTQADGTALVKNAIINGTIGTDGRFIPAPLLYTATQEGSGAAFDKFSYVVVDGAGLESVAKSVQIDVSGINTAPVAKVIGPTTGKSNTPLIICLGGVDPDIATSGDALTAYITGFPENARLYQVNPDLKTVNLNAPITKLPGQSVVVANRPQSDYAGCIGYVPITGYHGTALDTLQFYVVDKSGAQSPKLTFPVDITTTSSAPVASGVVGGLITTESNKSVVITLGASGSAGENLVSTITTLPSSGVLTNFDGTLITADQNRVTDSQFRVIYTPDASQTGVSTFAYKVKSQDSGLESGTSTVRVNVNSPSTGTNRLPQLTISAPAWSIQGDDVDTAKRVAYFSVAALDADGDPTRIVFTSLPDPKNGVLSYNGRTITAGDLSPTCNCFILDPAPSNIAKDQNGALATWTFVYKAADPKGVDKISFVVADDIVKNAADVGKYAANTITLDANDAKVGSGPVITGDSTTNGGNGGNGGNINGGSGANGSKGSNGNGYGNGDSSDSDLPAFWIIFIVICCVLCCLICITCIVLAVLLVRKRSGKGPKRTRRKGDYQNLGNYKPPQDDGL